MDTSIFTDLNHHPRTEELKMPLGNNFQNWMEIRNFALEEYPKAMEEWHVSVKNMDEAFV